MQLQFKNTQWFTSLRWVGAVAACLVYCVSRILFRMSLAMDVRCATYSVRLAARQFFFSLCPITCGRKATSFSFNSAGNLGHGEVLLWRHNPFPCQTHTPLTLALKWCHVMLCHLASSRALYFIVSQVNGIQLKDFWVYWPLLVSSIAIHLLSQCGTLLLHCNYLFSQYRWPLV